ncbi:MAG: nitroreductase family deazaflavin-dependent oxidoreductase [Candidatus Limnocylindrales bacterium]
MDPAVFAALRQAQVIDITTTGRRTGEPRRIEIVFHVIGGHRYISGMVGRRRAWLANLEADPRFTVHLKRTVRADVPAVARPITDEEERRTVFREIVKVWTKQDVETMVAGAPLIEMTFPDVATRASDAA